MPWISLISFGYIEVDFVVSEWISWILLFRQWISLDSGFCDSDWISWISLFRQTRDYHGIKDPTTTSHC